MKLAKQRTSILITFLSLWLIPASLSAADRLSRIEQDLVEESSIEHLSPGQVETALLETNNLALFDIRDTDEFTVSHLQNAIRVDPETSGEDFLFRYAEEIAGKQVIFYCSTGRRSTALAERVKQVLVNTQSDLPVPANLQGGIFRWHNNSQPLINSAGQTEFVHPYNWWWKRLLTRKAFTAYEPEF